MKPSLKKIVIFGLAAGLGQIIKDQLNDPEKKEKYFSDLNPTEIGLLIWNCSQIEQAGEKAINTVRAKIDRSKLRQAERKIKEVSGDMGQTDFLRMLSFLFLGLADLALYCNDRTAIHDLQDATLNFITQYDPNLELEPVHLEAHERYEAWLR